MKTEILAVIMVVLFLCTIIAYNVQVEKAEAEIKFHDDEPADLAGEEPLGENFSTPEIRGEYPPHRWSWAELRPRLFVFVSNETGQVIPSNIKLFVQDSPVNFQIISENNGYNVSYQQENGFQNGELVRCRLEGETRCGGYYEHQWKFRTHVDSISFSQNLIAGWNLISIPIEPVENSIESVFSSIEGKYDRIYGYDSSGEFGEWQHYSAGINVNFNDLETVELSKAYWIYMIEDATLFITGVPGTQNILLKVGWNLIGYPSMDEMIASDCLCGTGFTRIEGFDSSNPYLLRALDDSYEMSPGEGYWVYVPADTLWIVN